MLFRANFIAIGHVGVHIWSIISSVTVFKCAVCNRVIYLVFNRRFISAREEYMHPMGGTGAICFVTQSFVFFFKGEEQGGERRERGRESRVEFGP